MRDSYDVIVAGGGPSGAMAAWEAAKGGLSVCLLEKDKKIGTPVRCGEAIADIGLSQFIEPKPNWIAAKITGVKMVAPNGIDVDLDFHKETGYILNRTIFDNDLSKVAIEAGAEVYTESYVSNVIKEDDFVTGVEVERFGEKQIISCKILIGADGVASRVGRWAGIRTLVKMRDMESCHQYLVSNIDIDQSQMIMYVGKRYAPGGYLWIFPKGNKSANIGIGISGKYSKEKSAKSYLDEFMKQNYPEASIKEAVCGGVPCPKPHDKPYGNGIMLSGDAAHHINPVTGGGIAAGMKSGKFAGQVAVDAISNNNLSEKYLKKYFNLVMEDFGKRHKSLYNIKNTINNLADDDLNYIASKVSSTPKEKRTLTGVFKTAVYKKPSLIFDVIKAFAGS